MKPIRIGIIGTGNISHVHMNAYKQNPAWSCTPCAI